MREPDLYLRIPVPAQPGSQDLLRRELNSLTETLRRDPDLALFLTKRLARSLPPEMLPTLHSLLTSSAPRRSARSRAR